MTFWYIIGHYTLYNFFWWPVPEVVYHWGTVPNTEIHKTECWCAVTNQKTWLKLPVVQQCQAISESKYTCPYTKDSSFLKEFVVFGWSIFFCLVAKPTLFTLPSTMHNSQKDDILKQQILYYVLCVSSPSTSSSCSSRMRPPSVQAASVFGPFYFLFLACEIPAALLHCLC